MFILDRLLVGGLRFVLDKVALAADRELNDEDRLRDDLLAAQMQLELGEISEEEFSGIERSVLARLRELREEQGELSPTAEGVRIGGVEADVEFDEPDR